MNVIQGWLAPETMRHIVDVNKPYDKGYMFIFGNRYIIEPSFMKATYDLIAVPYTRWQEEGTKFFDGNANFISNNTVTELNQAAIYHAAGITNEAIGFRDAARAKSSMISNGVLEHVKGYGQEGGNYNAYINRA
jgi:hypothetical protein